MGKLVCDFCGTSYSDAATQCPICGCVNPAGADIPIIDDSEDAVVQSQYQYVKGGRFSKANVKKRNNKKNNKVEEKRVGKSEPSKAAAKQPTKTKKKGKSNKGLVITILVLLLAIIAVIAYNVVVFIFPVMFEKDGADTSAVKPSYSYNEPEETLPVLQSITVEPTQILLTTTGQTAKIQVIPVPVDAVAEVVFSSDNTAVATVDDNGTVTAVGAGDTVINVISGDISGYCSVSVTLEDEVFALEQAEYVLTELGELVQIYSGSLPLSDIQWSSDDEEVALIADGCVVAVGGGTTTVRGVYNGVEASCVIRCEFGENQEDDVNETTGAAAENGPYRLDNPYGIYDTDASITIGGSFTLYLLDKDENVVKDAVWTVEGGSCCTVEDGLVTGVSVGTAYVVATYGGESYKCIVRVS